MRRNNKKNKNLYNFIVYSSSMIIVSLFLICFLTIKNQCIKINSEITEMENSLIKNTNIIKDLQKEREYYLSETYISKFMGDIMLVAIPEPEIINITND